MLHHDLTHHDSMNKLQLVFEIECTPFSRSLDPFGPAGQEGPAEF